MVMAPVNPTFDSRRSPAPLREGRSKTRYGDAAAPKTARNVVRTHKRGKDPKLSHAGSEIRCGASSDAAAGPLLPRLVPGRLEFYLKSRYGIDKAPSVLLTFQPQIKIAACCQQPGLQGQAMSKLISIVTLDLEEAGALRRTARSIAAQTYRSYEWLVLGGGSNDASLAAIKEYGLLVDSWWSAPHRSVCDAMNLGLARVGGDYVIFMKAGDRFASETALERLAGALVRRPQPDLLFGGTMLELSGDRWLYRPPHAPHLLRSGPPAYHPATVFRRTAHLEALYDRRLGAAADYGAVAALLQRGASWRRLDVPIAIRCCRPTHPFGHGTRAWLAGFVRVQREILAMSWPAIGAGLIRLALADIVRPALRRGPLPSPGWPPVAQRWMQQHARRGPRADRALVGLFSRRQMS
jgi:hypothetical protein